MNVSRENHGAGSLVMDRSCWNNMPLVQLALRNYYANMYLAPLLKLVNVAPFMRLPRQMVGSAT